MQSFGIPFAVTNDKGDLKKNDFGRHNFETEKLY